MKPKSEFWNIFHRDPKGKLKHSSHEGEQMGKFNNKVDIPYSSLESPNSSSVDIDDNSSETAFALDISDFESLDGQVIPAMELLQVDNIASAPAQISPSSSDAAISPPSPGKSPDSSEAVAQPPVASFTTRITAATTPMTRLTTTLTTPRSSKLEVEIENMDEADRARMIGLWRRSKVYNRAIPFPGPGPEHVSKSVKLPDTYANKLRTLYIKQQYAERDEIKELKRKTEKSIRNQIQEKPNRAYDLRKAYRNREPIYTKHFESHYEKFQKAPFKIPSNMCY